MSHSRRQRKRWSRKKARRGKSRKVSEGGGRQIEHHGRKAGKTLLLSPTEESAEDYLRRKYIRTDTEATGEA